MCHSVPFVRATFRFGLRFDSDKVSIRTTFPATFRYGQGFDSGNVSIRARYFRYFGYFGQRFNSGNVSIRTTFRFWQRFDSGYVSIRATARYFGYFGQKAIGNGQWLDELNRINITSAMLAVCGITPNCQHTVHDILEK